MPYEFGREVTVKLPEPDESDSEVVGWLATWDEQHHVTVVAGSSIIKMFASAENGDFKIGNYSVQGAREYARVLLAAADYAEGGENAPV